MASELTQSYKYKGFNIDQPAFEPRGKRWCREDQSGPF